MHPNPTGITIQINSLEALRTLLPPDGPTAVAIRESVLTEYTRAANKVSEETLRQTVDHALTNLKNTVGAEVNLWFERNGYGAMASDVLRRSGGFRRDVREAVAVAFKEIMRDEITKFCESVAAVQQTAIDEAIAAIPSRVEALVTRRIDQEVEQKVTARLAEIRKFLPADPAERLIQVLP